MQSGLPKLAGLGSRYQLLTTLASGGMGKVYLARALGANDTRAVAIKVLHPHLAEDPEIVAMFLDEARIATKIHHPNVVRVHDLDMVGDDLVIVMEHVAGAPLHRLQRALHTESREMPIPFALAVVGDALAGLHAAHELTDDQGNAIGVVHRDVSPQNILVGADGIARVADFGIATSTGRLALTRPDGPVKGKLQYLAPEQIQRKTAPDRRVDVFAAGIVLWECLTGRTLFGGGTEAETLAMVLRDPIPPPSTYRSDVPSAIDDICLRALERDVARRFPTADDFRVALESVEVERLSPAGVGALVEELASEALAKTRGALASASLPAGPVSSVEDEGSLTVTRRMPRVGPDRVRMLALAAALAGLLGIAIWAFARTPTKSAESSPAASVTSAALADDEKFDDGLTVETSDPIATDPSSGPVEAGVARSTRRKPAKRPDAKAPFMPGHL